jgi:hypothetical protein
VGVVGATCVVVVLLLLLLLLLVVVVVELVEPCSTEFNEGSFQ